MPYSSIRVVKNEGFQFQLIHLIAFNKARFWKSYINFYFIISRIKMIIVEMRMIFFRKLKLPPMENGRTRCWLRNTTPAKCVNRDNFLSQCLMHSTSSIIADIIAITSNCRGISNNATAITISSSTLCWQNN